MHARKIVDEGLIELLDSILPVEITDEILPHLLINPKKVSGMLGAIEDKWWEEDPVDYDGRPHYNNCYRFHTFYSCGADKYVDRCKVCLVVKKVEWCYEMECGVDQNPWDLLGESRCMKYWDCEKHGHIDAILVSDRHTLPIIGQNFVRVSVLEDNVMVRKEISGRNLK